MLFRCDNQAEKGKFNNFFRRYCLRLLPIQNNIIIFRISLYLIFMFVFTLLLGSQGVFAAIYYVDYAAGLDRNSGTSKATPWQRCPGMGGFSGVYSHQVGDMFIFKGGVTWDTTNFPFTITYSGAAGNPDSYTTDHIWYTGGSWSQPIFDGGGTRSGAAALIYADNKSYVTINDIRLQNMGTASGGNWVYNGGRPIDWRTGGSGITISNCTFDPMGSHVIVGSFSGGAAYKNWLITGNELTRYSNAMEFAFSGAGTSLDNMVISNNTFHDPHLALLDNDHGDSIHLWDSYTGIPVTNLKIYNNKWYGDFSGGDNVTANQSMIYLEGTAIGSEIYNNDFSMTSTTNPYPVGYLFQAIIYGQGNPLKIHNNKFNFTSFRNPELGVRSCIKIAGGTSNNIYVQNNNCATGGKFALEVETSDLATSRAIAARVNSDYNNWYGAAVPVAVWTDYYYTPAAWQAASYRQDQHSTSVNQVSSTQGVLPNPVTNIQIK